MNMNTVIKSLSTVDLLRVYNALLNKTTTKFASRETGEKQTFGAAKVAGEAEFNKVLASLNIKVVTPDEQPAPTLNQILDADLNQASIKPAKAPRAKKPKPAPAAPAKHRDTHQCPNCGAVDDITPAGAENTIAGDEHDFCHGCGTEFWTASGKVYNRRKPGRDVSKSISRSWQDPETRSARSARHHVAVHEQGDAKNKTEYKSVAEAFRQLRLPMAKHIKFRMEVKDSGSGKFEHGKKIYVFTLVEAK